MRDDNKNLLPERILQVINRGKVVMKPRWHFILQTVLAISAILIIVLALLFLSSFIIFLLRQNGLLYITSFGPRAIREIFIFFPWLFFIAVIVFIFVLEILVRRYAFAYRQPLLYTILSIVVLVIAGSYIVDKTSLHHELYRGSQQYGYPIAGPLYKKVMIHHSPNVTPGVIMVLRNDGFTMRSYIQENINVIVLPETKLPYGAAFSSGDFVVVFGPLHNGTIQALGIRPLERVKMVAPLEKSGR